MESAQIQGVVQLKKLLEEAIAKGDLTTAKNVATIISSLPKDVVERALRPVDPKIQTIIREKLPGKITSLINQIKGQKVYEDEVGQYLDVIANDARLAQFPFSEAKELLMPLILVLLDTDFLNTHTLLKPFEQYMVTEIDTQTSTFQNSDGNVQHHVHIHNFPDSDTQTSTFQNSDGDVKHHVHIHNFSDF